MTTEKSDVSFEMYKWIKGCRPYHLTLGDILKWKKGEKVDVCMLDRNFEEYDIWTNAKPDKVFTAATFFAKNKATLTYKGDFIWDITYDYGETIEHPVHFCTSGLATSWTWVALECGNGGEGDISIIIDSEMLRSGIPFPKHKNQIRIRWQEFPKPTRVGWRGPMILWKHLSILPKVYWTEKKLEITVIHPKEKQISKESGENKESKENGENKESKENGENMETKENTESKESKENKESKESKENKENKESK